jgi:hypothetical protein
MDFRNCMRDCRTCRASQSMSMKSSSNIGVCSLGQSVMLFQQVAPLPGTRRFVRLLLMDAGRGVQSVRPTHLGFHQEVCMWSKDGTSDREGVLYLKEQRQRLFPKMQKQPEKRVEIRVSFETGSTLYVQVEECLSVSQYHHTAGVWEGMRVAYLFYYDKQCGESCGAVVSRTAAMSVT